jgi:hypothetical protein
MIDPQPVAPEHVRAAIRRTPNHLLRRCSASTRLTASESVRVAAFPARPDPMMVALTCELVTDHDGCHIAFVVAASGGERWWWLRWAPDRCELFLADTCEGTQTDGPWGDWCLLPQGHPGPHSFSIRPQTGHAVATEHPPP